MATLPSQQAAIPVKNTFIDFGRDADEDMPGRIRHTTSAPNPSNSSLARAETAPRAPLGSNLQTIKETQEFLDDDEEDDEFADEMLPMKSSYNPDSVDHGPAPNTVEKNVTADIFETRQALARADASTHPAQHAAPQQHEIASQAAYAVLPPVGMPVAYPQVAWGAPTYPAPDGGAPAYQSQPPPPPDRSVGPANVQPQQGYPGQIGSSALARSKSSVDNAWRQGREIMPERAHVRHAQHSYSSSHDAHIHGVTLIPPEQAVQRQLDQAAQQADSGKGRMSRDDAVRKEAQKMIDTLRLMEDVADVPARDFAERKPVLEYLSSKAGEWSVLLRFVIPPEQFQTTNKAIPQAESAKLPNGAFVRMNVLPRPDARDRADRGPSVHNANYFDFQLRCDDVPEGARAVRFESWDEKTQVAQSEGKTWELAHRAVSETMQSRLMKPRGMLPATLCVRISGSA